MTPKFCLEADCLYHALLGSIEIHKEVQRSRAKAIFFDVGRFYQPAVLENLKMAKRIVEEIARPLASPKSTTAFVENLHTFVTDFDSTCDAFYSHRPFFLDVFKQTVIYFQEAFRSRVSSAWETNAKEFSAKQILEIAAACTRWDFVLCSWKITDANFAFCARPLTETFFTTLFENNRTSLANILTDFVSTYSIVDGIAHSSAMDSLENHFMFVLDHYTRIPTLYCLEESIRYVGRVLHATQLAIYRHLQAPSLSDPRVLISIINSSFLKLSKNISRKVSEISAQQLDPKTIKIMMNDRFISFINLKIINSCKSKFLKSIAEKIRSTFASQKDILDLNLTFNMREILSLCDSMIRLFAVPDHLPEFFHFVFTKIIKNYVLLFAASQPKMTSQNSQRYEAKVSADTSDFDKLCVESLVDNSEFVKRRFSFLSEFLHATDLDVILISLLNLNLFCKRFHDPQTLRMLVETRLFLPKDSEDYLMNHFLSQKPNKPVVQLSKAQIARKRMKMFLHTALILLFYFKLSDFTRDFNC